MPEEVGKPLKCMAHAWALSNFIDGATDTFYGGDAPTQGQVDDILTELSALSDCAPPQMDQVAMMVKQAKDAMGGGNRDEAFRLMSQARRQLSDMMNQWRG